MIFSKFKISLLAAACVSFSTIAQAPLDVRVALVIGNAAYRDAPLTNPVNDARAIALAIGEAGVGDVVLLAGKGHEDYQEIGGRRLAFSDLLAAQECLQAGKAAMPPQGAA